MEKTVKINSKKPEIRIIRKAAAILKKGGLIIIPTETVYGVVSDAFDSRAVSKIFRVKKRSRENPLLVLISKKNDIKKLAKDIPREAKQIINKLWPGPLTIILRKRKSVPKIVTGGGDTIAIRMSPNPVVLALIKKFGRPITAPSANISGKPPSRTVGKISEGFRNKKEISLILDAGKTRGGVSTVLDLTQKPFKILRTGNISKKQIDRVLG